MTEPQSPEVQRLLSQLNGIESAGPISVWPLAPGWWFLAFALMLISAIIVYQVYARRKRNAYRRQALQELADMKATEHPQFAADISVLLKRTALTAYPDHSRTIAGLFGPEWVRWLNESVAGAPFQEDVRRALAEGPYREDIAFNPEDLRVQARRWILAHPRRLTRGKTLSAEPVSTTTLAGEAKTRV